MYDSIIIGAGPAGMTSAIYLIRKKASINILTEEVGGQIVDSPLMENYPGIEKISGPEWVSKVRTHAENLGVKFQADTEVKKISQIEGGFEIEGIGLEKQTAKSVLITSGKRPRKLNVPGEADFVGKGISSCVTCDGPLFTGKTVAVIGGGNSAIVAALELEKYVEKVYILNLGEKLIGEEVRIDKIESSSKIEVIPFAKTTSVYGSNLLEGLKYEDLKTKEEKDLPCQGIFIEIGWEPSTDYLKGFIDLNEKGEIIIDKNNSTSVKGIFAAGDVTDISHKQTIIACGEGAKAAMSTWDYLTALKG